MKKFVLVLALMIVAAVAFASDVLVSIGAMPYIHDTCDGVQTNGFGGTVSFWFNWKDGVTYGPELNVRAFNDQSIEFNPMFVAEFYGPISDSPVYYFVSGGVGAIARMDATKAWMLMASAEVFGGFEYHFNSTLCAYIEGQANFGFVLNTGLVKTSLSPIVGVSIVL